eukprot:TRINITY_DN18025_c0_g1_i1.p1 TRINITY_DN18025_c0_g1~~TRINITY_DN18025_c0_g1_i1.p1  ORF type:complete len:332 (-),score=68.90 TRINITY_DN18025_c0_g1_i1:113-1084(-)
MGSNYSIIGTVFGNFTQASSYGHHGFERHKKEFNPEDLNVNLEGKHFLITGANSGIGRESALQLAKLGGTVHLLCRNLERGEEARTQLISLTNNQNIFLHQLDVADLDSVRKFASEYLQSGNPIFALVHNAGALPTERKTTAQGNEYTFATHVLGPFLLTALLKPKLEECHSRVIFVTSAGMYAAKLDNKNLQSDQGDFDGALTYARMKRAQVTIVEIMAERMLGKFSVNLMHPGWTHTPGLKSLFEDKPIFKPFENLYRNVDEGADTIVWLCAKEKFDETGKLYFDREVQSTSVKLAGTEPSQEESSELWNKCCELTQIESF